MERYHRYLDRLVELAEKEVERTTREDARFTDLARFYVTELGDVRHLSRAVSLEPGARLRQAPRRGQACGATHGFLPLMDTVPQAVRAQVQVAVAHYPRAAGPGSAGNVASRVRRHPGQDRFLVEAGIRYSFLESTG